MHQAQTDAREQSPTDIPTSPVTPPGGEREEGEEDQQHFVNVILAVEDHRRGDGRKDGRPNRGVPAEPIGDERQQQNEPQSERHGDQPQFDLGEMSEVRRARQPRDGQRGVEERRSVMFVRIVLIPAVGPKLAELDAVDRLVIMHRALVQERTAQGQGQACGRQQTQQDGAVHPNLGRSSSHYLHSVAEE